MGSGHLLPGTGLGGTRVHKVGGTAYVGFIGEVESSQAASSPPCWPEASQAKQDAAERSLGACPSLAESSRAYSRQALASYTRLGPA